MIKDVLYLNLIWITIYARAIALKFVLTIELLYNIIVAAWVVYGLNLYFSDKNQCKASFPMTQMVFCLLIGSIVLISIGCLICCCFPLAYFGLRRAQQEQEGRQENQINTILATLNREYYQGSKY